MVPTQCVASIALAVRDNLRTKGNGSASNFAGFGYSKLVKLLNTVREAYPMSRIGARHEPVRPKNRAIICLFLDHATKSRAHSHPDAGGDPANQPAHWSTIFCRSGHCQRCLRLVGQRMNFLIPRCVIPKTLMRLRP